MCEKWKRSGLRIQYSKPQYKSSLKDTAEQIRKENTNAGNLLAASLTVDFLK